MYRHFTILQGKPQFKASIGDTCEVITTKERYWYTESGWEPFPQKTPSTPKKGTRKKKD